MGKTLRDQLMGAGLASKQQVRQAKSSSKKQKAAARSSGELTEEQKRRAELNKQKAAQAERDRELNHALEQERQQKALAAQVVQLIEMNSVDRSAGDLGYNFVVGQHVKKIYVTPEIQQKLSRGLLAIVQLPQGEGEYRIVPTTVAKKIGERMPELILMESEAKELTEEENDWYADYQIPDDLMW